MFVWFFVQITTGGSFLSPWCRIKVKHGQRKDNGLSYAHQQFLIGVLKSQSKQEVVKWLSDMGPKKFEKTSGVYCVLNMLSLLS